jgi:hypothetical protein
MSSDELGIYTKRVGESQKAFAAYCEYREMGAERSLEAVHRKFGKSSRLLARWSSYWSWVKRAAAYDADLAKKEHAAKEYALEAESKKWVEREIAMRETYWQLSMQVVDKIRQILLFPLQTVERKQTQASEDGKTIINNITIIKPINFTQRDAGMMLKAAFEVTKGLFPPGAGTTPEPQTGEGGMMVEDIEVIKRKRWIDAAPALLALLEAKQAELESGQDGNSAEPSAS